MLFLCWTEWQWRQPVTWTSAVFLWILRPAHWSWRAVSTCFVHCGSNGQVVMFPCFPLRNQPTLICYPGTWWPEIVLVFREARTIHMKTMRVIYFKLQTAEEEKVAVAASCSFGPSGSSVAVTLCSSRYSLRSERAQTSLSCETRQSDRLSTRHRGKMKITHNGPSCLNLKLFLNLFLI